MTPQERKLVEELFEKLATLETQPRERDAEQTIMEVCARRRMRPTHWCRPCCCRTRRCAMPPSAFANWKVSKWNSRSKVVAAFDPMRDTLFGGGARPRSSVPPVGGGDRPMGLPPGYGGGNPLPQAGYPGAGAPPQAGVPPQQGGGSFLGTAAAAAVGTIGGAMLMNSLGGMFGQSKQGGTATSAADLGGSKDSNPWGGSGDASSSDLAKQAGVDNVGQSGSSDRAGFSDQAGKGQDQESGPRSGL